MGDATKDEAIRILASLVGLEPNIIHDTLKDVAMEIIEATEGNVLALACLATHFDDIPCKTDEKAWLEALDDLPNILNCQERKIVLGLGLHKSPRRSFWSAMEVCLKSLETREAKVILFLIYACQGHSVPQEILTIWYECINTSSSTFSRSQEELRSRELVNFSSGGLYTYLEGNDRDLKVPTYGVWSLQPLVKLYIEHLANDKTEAIKEEVLNSKIGCAMDSLLNDKKFPVGSSVQQNSASGLEDVDNEKAKVAIVLCALYFHHSHAERLVLDLATKAQSASNLQDCSLLDGRRQAMEPITWLLGQPKNGKWTELGLHSARKVFLTYICERQLDGEGFSTLLSLDADPPAQLATLRALLSVFAVEDIPLPWQHARRILKAVLALLDSNGRCSPSVQEAASKALVPMVEIMLRFLSLNDRPDLRLQAALALTVLTVGDEESIGKKILKEDGAVADVVKFWSQHHKGGLQEEVIKALNHLACQEGDSIKLAIVNEEGVLTALVQALVAHNNGSLQEVAACALSRLALSGDQSIISKIGTEKGAITGLVKCMSIKGHRDLEEYATSALASLAYSPNKVAIANEPGALAALVKLMLENNLGVVQGHAARVIANLVDDGGEWDSIRLQILNENGAQFALVKALYVEDNPYFQAAATCALAGLASGGEILEQRIANDSMAIAGLMKLFFEHNKSASRRFAARALRNLCCSTDDRIRVKLGYEDRALACLVECLSKHDETYLQEDAVYMLCSLALMKDDTLKLKIRNEDGLVTALVSLSQQDNPLSKVAKCALEALGLLGGAT